MSLGILRPGATPDWEQLTRAARETCRDLSHDRALNIVRVLPAVAAYGRELESDRLRLEAWCEAHGMTLDQWREMVDKQRMGNR
jgi:hypothetical protein